MTYPTEKPKACMMAAGVFLATTLCRCWLWSRQCPLSVIPVSRPEWEVERAGRHEAERRTIDRLVGKGQ